MSFFRPPREQRPAAPPSEPAAAAKAPPAPASEALATRLREIAAAAPAPEDAFEPALGAILEASHAQAGALCLYDVRNSVLRLTAESGLSDEGCRRLRSVRRSDPTAWDMPLQGLLNRRAYLIESAARNRYVPPLVEKTAAVRTIACVPLYAGQAPLGSLVLIALAPRSLGERDIGALGRALAELTTMIEAVRRRGGVEAKAQRAPARPAAPPVDVSEITAERNRLRDEATARLAERTSLAADRATQNAEVAQLRGALEAAAAERAGLATQVERARREAERARSLATALAAVEDERTELAAKVEAAAAERTARARAELALDEARAAAERSAAAAAAELERVRRAAAAAESGTSARMAELAAEIESLRARVEQADQAVAGERALARDLERERERLAQELDAAAEREDRLRHELQTASQKAASAGEGAVRHALEAARAAEEARAVAVAEAEALRGAYGSAQEVILALEDEAAGANAEVGRVGAATRAERDRLEVALRDAREREQAATARMAELVREADRLRDENKRLALETRERTAEAADLTARLGSVAAERDRQRDLIAAADAERERLAAATTAAAAAETRLGESLARESTERARLTAALGSAEAAVQELEAALARQASDAADHAATIERLRAECDRLRAERDARAETAAAARPEQPVRVVTLAPAGGARARTREHDRRVIGVLDADAAWGGMAPDGHEVVVISPAEDVVDRLARLTPSRVVVNLAAPGALDSLGALRAAGSTTRFWGCIADPVTDRALPLGMIEPATSPLDPEAIVDILASYGARGTRVVTAGADVDTLMSLRQALARAGLSVSMAWDAKQAADLLQVVRPEVVVVDLGLPRRDGYAIVGQLTEIDPVPSAVVLPGAEDAAPGFAGVLVDPGHAARTLALAELLAAMLGRHETSAAERRQKVVAVARK